MMRLLLWFTLALGCAGCSNGVGRGEHCGGNFANQVPCQPGLVCTPAPGQTIPFGDVGGICEPPPADGGTD